MISKQKKTLEREEILNDFSLNTKSLLALTLLLESKEIKRKTKQKDKSTKRNLTRKQNYFHVSNLATGYSTLFLYPLNKKNQN